MEERKLTREQRRHQQRISDEARITFGRLAEMFFNFFIENDPDSELVKDKEKEVIRKWKMFCKQRNLIPDVYEKMTDHCERVRKDYTEAV